MIVNYLKRNWCSLAAGVVMGEMFIHYGAIPGLLAFLVGTLLILDRMVDPR